MLRASLIFLFLAFTCEIFTIKLWNAWQATLPSPSSTLSLSIILSCQSLIER